MRNYQRQRHPNGLAWTTQLALQSILGHLLLLPIPNHVVAQDQSNSSQADVSSSTTTVLIVLICLFFAAGFVSVYLRHYAWCFAYNSTNGRGGGVGGRWQREAASGLDPTLIHSLPTFLFSQVKIHRIGKGPLECAVCLNEFADEQRLRLLPGCSHVFHPDCIDPWLASHVTCPICRANLQLILIQQPQPIRLFDPRSLSDDDHELDLEALPFDDQLPAHPPHNDGQEGHVIIPIIRRSPEAQAQAQAQVNINMIKSPVATPAAGEEEQTKEEAGRGGTLLRKLTRSHSTGHSLREDGDRFTLRLPEELLRNKLGEAYANHNNNNNNVGALPAALISPRIGYRTRSVGCTGMATKPECWRFSASPPFIISPRGTGLPWSPKSDVQDSERGSSTSNMSGHPRGPGPGLGLGLFKSIKSPLKREASRSNDIGERSSDWLRTYPPSH